MGLLKLTCVKQCHFGLVQEVNNHKKMDFYQMLILQSNIYVLMNRARKSSKPKPQRGNGKHEEMNVELAIKTLGVPKKESSKYFFF